MKNKYKHTILLVKDGRLILAGDTVIGEALPAGIKKLPKKNRHRRENTYTG